MISKIFFFFLLLFSFSTSYAVVDINTTSSVSTEKRGLFSTIDSIKNQKIQITELQWAVTLEEQNINTLSEMIQSFEWVYQKLTNLENQIVSSSLFLSGSIDPNTEVRFTQTLSELSLLLPVSSENFPTTFSEYEKQKKIVQENYTLLLEENTTKKLKRQENLLEYTSKLESAQSELQTQEKLLTELYKTLARNLGTLFGFVIIIFLISHLIQWAIRSRSHLIEDKKNVLTHVVKWIGNTLIIGMIAVFFFSELLSFLPFLAILGTAIGFALRDIISSFIAWFLIGHKDSVYKIGDVIEVEWDNVFGRVFKISPVVTTIQELGLSGPSGMYKSFPNKAIFEKSIKNISKINNWIYITIDFLLDKSSSVPKSKALLLDVMNEVITHEQYSSPFEARAPFRKYGITEANMHPQIFLDIKPQWIFFRGKVFVYWPERHDIRSEIVEKFFERAQKDSSIQIKQVEIG